MTLSHQGHNQGKRRHWFEVGYEFFLWGCMNVSMTVFERRIGQTGKRPIKLDWVAPRQNSLNLKPI